MGAGFVIGMATGLTPQAEPRRAPDVNRESGTANANRRWLQRIDTPIKALLVFCYHLGDWAGSVSSTPRITKNKRCSMNTITHNSMKYYTSTTEYNCGIDLHARQMYVCVMDRQGKKLVHTNVKDNDFQFLDRKSVV